MNNIPFLVAKASMYVLSLSFFIQIGWSADNSALNSIEKDILKERIETLYSPVDLRYTDEVHKIINTYIGTYRKGSERLLGLSERFFPLYESEFARQGLPEELKYLSVVESGLRPNVVSHAGAVGLWQFMKSTSKLYGLTTNSVVDERRDHIRSTQAATLYLKDLYLQFGDWTLALAAYNCGPGNVRKALRRSSKDEFWDLKSFLPKETRRYIPKYVAISYMMSYSHAHGLTPVMDYDVNTLVTVRVHDYTKLKHISSISGLEFDSVKELNPAFLKNYIPKSSKGYLLTLPEINMYNYLVQAGGWENIIEQPFHSVSLQQKFYRYGAMKQKLDELLPLTNTKSILSIQPSNDFSSEPKLPSTNIIGPKQVMSYRTQKEGSYHKLEAQQSLGDVANILNVSLKELIELNDIDLKNPPRPGSMIRIK